MTHSTVSIRLAVEQDAAAIADIYNEAIRSTTATFDTEPKTVGEREAWLHTHDERHPVWVAEVNGNVVGWAALTLWSDRPAYEETAETSFYVAESFRGKGIGRVLKAHVIEAAQRRGFHTLLARMAEGSDASIHINESFGFRSIGTMREVGFKFGKRLDVHLMQLMLNEPPHTESEVKRDVVRQHVSTETPWERSVGYSRAVRVGNTVFVSGTTASDKNGRAMFVGDAYGQTRYILGRIADALTQVGSDISNVTRTRMFVTDIARWEDIGRAHGEVFGNIRPAATMVEVARLIDPEHLIEVEVDAVISRGHDR